MHHKYYGEVLPYLEIQKNDVGADASAYPVEMPEVTGMELEEAKKVLGESGLEIEVSGEGEKVTEQLPKKGIQINAGTKVTVYTE